jgi:hypothetical protein
MVTNRPGVRSAILSSVCFAALLSAALPAKALVLTYDMSIGPGSGSFDKSAATGNPNQARPMQLPITGGANGPNARNFIFQLGTADSAGPGLGSPIWTPVNQYGSDSNAVSVALDPGQQRFDYTFDAADDTSGAPDIYKWNNTFKLISFGTFYLDGACNFCGADKPVSILDTLPAYSGSARREADGKVDVDPGNNGKPFYLAGNFYDSNVFNIRFGSTDITGTLQFNANSATLYTWAQGGHQVSWGQVVLNINEDTSVPIDLPPTTMLLAAGLAGIGIQRRRRLCP